MIVETQLDFKKYLGLMYLLTYRKWWMIYLTVLGFIVFIMSILYFAGVKTPFDSPPYFQLVFGLIIVFLPFSVFINAKMNFSSAGRLQEKITYEFTDDRYKITGESFNSEISWGKTYKVIELNSWILIYQSRRVANVIPKEAFGETLNEFRNLIRRQPLIKQKLKG